MPGLTDGSRQALARVPRRSASAAGTNPGPDVRAAEAELWGTRSLFRHEPDLLRAVLAAPAAVGSLPAEVLARLREKRQLLEAQAAQARAEGRRTSACRVQLPERRKFNPFICLTFMR